MVLGALDVPSEPPTVSVVLACGDQMLLYTDGLLESLRPRMSPEGLMARCVMARTNGTPVIELVDELIAEATASEDQIDDIAALVFEVT
jgi:hypothetical protein